MVRILLIAKQISYVALFVLLAFGGAEAQSNYKKYTNDRFFFEIEYPPTFSMGQAPANNDGRTFISADGKAELRAWGSYNALDHTLAQEYQWQVDNFEAPVSYHVVSGNWFVISGSSNGKIIYQKTIHRKDKKTDVYYSFRIEYPDSQKKTYDPIVTRIQRSFRWIPGGDV